jgi:hypothetical protein
VVADSLSAVLSHGYTIDSRQGAVRTMVKMGLFARRADVAFPVLHHLTKDGKVAGSAGVLNSVRLAYVIEPAKDDESVRVVTRHKSNITEAPPLRYVIEGDTPLTHAAFVDAGDQRTERLRVAQEAAADEAPEAGTLRARVAAAAAPEPGPFRVIRRATAPDGTAAEVTYVGDPHATREGARGAAGVAAGRVLDWAPVASVPGMEAAVFDRSDGTRVTYGVCPQASEGN